MAEPTISRNAGDALAAPLADVNENSIEIGVVAIDGVQYAATPPLRFDVSLDPRSELYEVAGEFGILLSCPTRAELEDTLNDTLAMLWREYAEEDPATLSPKAAALRSELRARSRLRWMRSESQSSHQEGFAGTSSAESATRSAKRG